MLLLEAARQAARAAGDPCVTLPTGMDVAFFRYVELDAPCWITAEPVDRSLTRVTAVQHGQTVFSAAVASTQVPRIGL
jgi:hypothetical protein